MILKSKTLNSLTKRELWLGVVTTVCLLLVVYWYMMLAPMIKKENELLNQVQELVTKSSDFRRNVDNTASMQQQKALLHEKEELLTKIHSIKNTQYIKDSTFISKEISTLGQITHYKFSEILQTTEATKYSLKIEHNSNYIDFITNVRRIKDLYPEVALVSINMKNKVYTSEWSLWLKK